MKAILILAGPYSSCAATKNIWQDICLKHNINFETHDLSESIGKKIAVKMSLKSFPALLINDKVVAVGHPSEQAAEKVIQAIVA
ncbi:MAG: thioredoxin family protein [Gammaproteobacteria bacterium]|nr:thioredoxin family protein [Gammaproteobacteria bacterium]MCW8987932.1 thioredoxin family protein [Gammaproteobacteria bacterium]MCW9030303.1 thioredoxin family protein [Gammaproteobacteria bacterium]